eukprot:937986-Amorphochlora_amoeboformis.AAC.1
MCRPSNGFCDPRYVDYTELDCASDDDSVLGKQRAKKVQVRETKDIERAERENQSARESQKVERERDSEREKERARKKRGQGRRGQEK